MMGFAINAKSRLWSDAKTVTSKTVSNEERLMAARGLTATVAEILVYRALLFAVSELWQAVSNAITGEPDDDEDKKKRSIKALANTSGNVVNDLFVPPVPGLDILAYRQINKVLEATGVDSTLPDALGVEDVKFRLYDKFDDEFFDRLGTIGIGPAKLVTWSEYLSLAATGKYKIDIDGDKIEKKLSEEDQDLAQINAALYTVYILGAPGDIDAVVRKNDKTLKTRGLTEKQAKVQRKVGAADYKIMRENDIKSERQLMLFKALGKKQYQEYKAREKQIREARKKLREGL